VEQFHTPLVAVIAEDGTVALIDEAARQALLGENVLPRRPG
jgi:hypothetical protein